MEYRDIPCKPIKGSRLNMMAGKNFFKCFYKVVSGGLFMFGDSLMDKPVARFIGVSTGKVSAFYAGRPTFNDNARYVVVVFRTPAEGWYWTLREFEVI